MIRIVNKYKRDPKLQGIGIDVYCGRPTAVGNPFSIKECGGRDAACDAYQEYFDKKVAAKDDVAFMDELRAIYRLARKGDVNLVCFCAPKRCHTETIKAFVESHL